jgi:Spy/CpxP family protein refolding chaperone
MNRIRPITTLCLTLTALLFAGTLAAQQGPGPWHDSGHGHRSAEDRLAFMARELNLSQQQSQELLAIFQAADQERFALREEFMLQNRERICQQIEDTHQDILAVLDEEQAAAFEQMMAERERRHKSGRHRGPAGRLDCPADAENDS